MIRHHDTGTKIQVYLRPAERNRLERLTATLGASKSDVVRQGLEALERQLTDPDQHPALGIVGIVAAGPASTPDGSDVARNHDDYLAADELASWSKRRRPSSQPHDSE